ncbi:MAG: hypothetical protein ABW352_25335 [Polyangiales bacterium]
MWLVVALAGCSPFEPPITEEDASFEPVDGDDASVQDAEASVEAGDDASVDTGVPDAAAPADANVADADAGAGVDAGPDASVMIPRRPTLAKCGFAAPAALGTVTEPGLNEVSGIAASRRNPRVVWVNEDSGNGAVVHALNDQGTLVASYGLSGNALDYEDIAVGPGPEPGVSYLYVADIGDNNGSRANVVIYRAPEPEVLWNQARISATLAQVTPFPMRYPEGARNAEAFMVDVNQDFYLVTKDGFTRPNNVYRLPAPQQATVQRTLELVTSVYGGTGTDVSITSGDINADGSRIILRSLHAATHWTRASGATIDETLRNVTPCDAELANESKGESISFGATGYFTISEGTGTPLHFVSFTP